MARSVVRWSSFGLLALAGACAAVRPQDVPPAAPATITSDVARNWPGAKGILDALDVRGEAGLRNGDAVLFGLEIARGGATTARLLRIVVRRAAPTEDRARVCFTGGEGERPSLPSRWARGVVLEFTLFDENGKELQQSRSERTPDYFLEASFVDGIVAARGGDERSAGIAAARLLQVVRLLQQDPILQSLLAEVASVPFDLRLLFRRELLLIPQFEAGVEVVPNESDPFAAALGPRYELPFDLHLNDSLFVRLSATVTTPAGPTGAAAGIVSLRAQQASDPTRHIRMQLLACARGPRTEWQQYGMVANCGAVDEGLGLAFSPDGRFVATPGERGVVELRDLQAGDPTVAERLVGDGDAVGDLAFLSASTLLVGRGSRVEVFEIAGAATGGERRPAAVVPTPMSVRAIEVANERTCFLGYAGGAVERWTFAPAASAADIENVRAASPSEARIGAAPPVPFLAVPAPGFLVAGDDRDRVVVGWRGIDTVYRRLADGSWHGEALPAPQAKSRAQRWGAADAAALARVGKGAGWVGHAESRRMAYGGATIQLARPTDKGMHMVVLTGHVGDDEVVHGLDPSGRFYAFVSPGFRLLVDATRDEATR